MSKPSRRKVAVRLSLLVIFLVFVTAWQLLPHLPGLCRDDLAARYEEISLGMTRDDVEQVFEAAAALPDREDFVADPNRTERLEAADGDPADCGKTYTYWRKAGYVTVSIDDDGFARCKCLHRVAELPMTARLWRKARSWLGVQ